MNPNLQRIYDNTPEDKPRSRLEPYRELIMRWRRQGRTYRRICELLRERFGTNIGKTALHKFVRRRLRPRGVQPELELQPVTGAPEPEQDDELAAMGRYTKLSPDQLAKQRALIQNLRNNRPVVVREVRKRFVYDPGEPLILEKHKQES
jgi:hypothetical protein